MKVLTTNATKETPRILLDKENNKFEFEGRSRPENVSEFYHPVLHWFEEYHKNPNKETVVNMNFEYFNTSSAKAILELLKTLESYYLSGMDIKILWHYHIDDEDMQDSGEDYASMVKLPFEYKVFE